MELARRIRQIPPSATLALNAKANQLKAQGVDVVNFGVGEPDFDTPKNIRKAAIKAIEDGFTRYTPVGGILELKEAIIKTFHDRYHLSYSPAEIMVSCGGKHALYNLFQVIFDQGDEVVVPAPFWVSYPPMLMLAEAKPVIIPTREENGFKLTAEELKAQLTPKTKGLILNSPSNPTGMVYTQAELEALAEVVLAHNLLVISDDIYDRILFDGASFVNLAMLSPELKARTFVLNGLSKTYAMTGWRMGYGVMPQFLVEAVNKLMVNSNSCTASFTQRAGIAALDGPQDETRKMVAEFRRRRDAFVDGLNSLPGFRCARPLGAFYAFPNVQGTGWESKKLADALLAEAGVACVDGACFGAYGEGYIRFSYANSYERLMEAVERIRKFLTAGR